MNTVRLLSGLMAGLMLSGCVSAPDGAGGPKLVGSSVSTESAQYAEVGVEFSSMGDFVALVSPARWKSPLKAGGSLSWINPAAWRADPGRTGRILLGEAVMVGGVAAAAGGGSADGGGAVSSSDDGGDDGGSTPTPPGLPPSPAG